jgi:hypothetical protein
MATSFGALCNDFYVNQRLSLKLDLPSRRETVLDLFDRLRKFRPQMDKFRRFDGELALESAPADGAYDWLALRRTSIRSGSVNPDTLDWAYELHRTVLEVSPYFLSISPLDIDYLELMFGFDLEAHGNHDEIVFDALLAESPMGSLIDTESETLTDVQPFISFALDEDQRYLANLEVKTRSVDRPAHPDKFDDEPISLFLSVRHMGPVERIEDLVQVAGELARQTERLTTDKLIPQLLNPISRAINSRSC